MIKGFSSFNSSGTEPSCDAALFVRSGTVVEAAPGQKVALICPVEPCGEDVKVSWCKVQSIECKVIFETKDVEIAQIGSSRDHRWHSYLHFKRISLEDAGLYRCFINEDESESEMISNGITVKVSGALGFSSGASTCCVLGTPEGHFWSNLFMS